MSNKVIFRFYQNRPKSYFFKSHVDSKVAQIRYSHHISQASELFKSVFELRKAIGIQYFVFMNYSFERS